MKPKRNSSMQKQLDWEAQKKEAFWVPEFNKRSVRLVTRPVNSKKYATEILGGMYQELVIVVTKLLCPTTSPTKKHWRRVLLTSWNISSQCIWKMKRFHEVPPGNHHWKLLEKREKQAIERRQEEQPRAELAKVGTRKVPVTVPTKTVFFVPTVSNSMVENMSVSSFVSVHCGESHDTPKTSAEAAVFRSCGNAEKRYLISRKTQKSESEDYRIWQTITWIKVFQ